MGLAAASKKWKPTLLYWLFALSLGLAPLLFERNLIRQMMQKCVSLPDAIWTRLNLTWAVFRLDGGVYYWPNTVSLAPY